MGTSKIAFKRGRVYSHPHAAALPPPVPGACRRRSASQDLRRRLLSCRLCPCPGFYWTTRSTRLPHDPLTVIACDGVWLVALNQRVDDNTWVASLDRHRHGLGGPSRRYSSYEQGRAGAEMWVARHEARLRADVAAINRWRRAVRANRLAKLNTPSPFGWMG